MSENTGNVEPSGEPELQLEKSRSKAVLWVGLGLLVVIGLGFAAITMVGGSVLYYKTPTEVVAQAPGVSVRLAGQLVPDSVNEDSQGGTSFKITDGKTTVSVVYNGGATTALATASKPGTQMVAEGALGTDGVFKATNLLAKCPSKFQSTTKSPSPAP